MDVGSAAPPIRRGRAAARKNPWRGEWLIACRRHFMRPGFRRRGDISAGNTCCAQMRLDAYSRQLLT
jgi:hypothetical protein